MLYVCVLVAQSCPTLCDPMGCSPPGSSVLGIFQARSLEWVAISSSRGSSWPSDWIWVLCVGRQMPHHLSHQGSPLCCLYDRKPTLGISLMVQWLIPCSQCKGPRFNPRELRYLMLQLSSRKLQIRPSAAKYIKKKKQTNKHKTTSAFWKQSSR